MAKALLPLVNDPDHYEIFQEHLSNRIEVLRGYLENTQEHQKVIFIQGQISELRTMQTLREQAIEMARNK